MDPNPESTGSDTKPVNGECSYLSVIYPCFNTSTPGDF